MGSILISRNLFGDRHVAFVWEACISPIRKYVKFVKQWFQACLWYRSIGFVLREGDTVMVMFSCCPAWEWNHLGSVFSSTNHYCLYFSDFIHTMNTLLDGMGNYASCRKTNASMHVQGPLALNMRIMVYVVVVLTSWACPTLGAALLVPIHRL